MKHKSMFRRLLSVLLCLTMVFSLLPTSALAEGLEEPVAEPETQPEQAGNGSFNLKIDFVSQDGTALAEAYEASAAQGTAWEGTVPFVAVDGYRPAKVEFGEVKAENALGAENEVLVYGECANVALNEAKNALVLSGAAVADVHVIVTYAAVAAGEPVEEQPAEEQQPAKAPAKAPLSIVDPVPAIDTYNFVVDGETVSTQRVKEGETVYAPASPEKAGYKFVGWFEGDAAFAAGAKTGVAGIEHTVTARFEEIHYVFFLNDEGVVSTTKEGTNGDVIAADAKFPVDADKAITGWYTDADLTNKVESVTLTDSNIILYPKVETGSWITFNSDGGTYVEPVFVAPGTATVAPAAPARIGYTFQGWYNGNDEFAFGNTLSENVTLTARWQGNANTQYTIVYWIENADDDGYSYESQATGYGVTGATITLSGNAISTSHIDSAYSKYFTYKTYDTGKTISGDGSTIVNVYFSRNTYTLTFQEEEGPFWSSSWVTKATITAKYNAYIADEFNKAPFSTTYKGRAWDATTVYNYALQTLDRMPGANVTFHLYDKRSDTLKTIYYWVETVEGGVYSQTKTFGGKTYGLLKTVDTYFRYMTYNEEYHEIQGFERLSRSDAGFDRDNSKNFSNNKADLYYNRASYNLEFYNVNATVKTESVKYEAPLASHLAYTPARPAGVPENVVFKGWYTSPACEDGTEAVTNLTKMPAGNIMVYAKWAAPVFTGIVHMQMAGNGETHTFEIVYGSKIDESKLPEIVIPEGYTWRGWATRDEQGNYTPFNFETEIYADITLYPYYTSNQAFSVNYGAGEGSGTVPVDAKRYADGSYADVMAATGLTAPEGKVFLGWEADGKVYQPGDKIAVHASNIVLTAVWGDKASTAVVTYHANGGVGDDVTSACPNNSEITLIANPFTREGYEFIGWATAPDAAAPYMQPGDKVVVDNTPSNDFYAMWKQANFTLTIDYEYADGSTAKPTYTETVTSGADYNVVSPVIPGYTADIPVVSGTMPGEDVTVTVKYTENGPVTIEYKATTGGSVSLEKESVATATGMAQGSTATADAEHYFVNWTDSENNVVSTDAKFVPGKNADGIYEAATYTAHFAPKNVVNVTITGATASGVYNATAYTADGFTVNGDLPEGVTITLKEGVTAQASRTDAGTTNMNLTADSFNINNVPANYKVIISSVTDGYVTVTPRPVTLTSATDSKTYDGTALTNNTVTASTGENEGFVDGEGASYNVTGSQTVVGSSDNSFSYTLNEGTKAGNYNITTKNGTLTVNATDAEVVVTITENSGSYTYDGTEKSVTGYKVTNISNELYSKDYFSFSGNAVVTGTAAGTYNMELKPEDFTNNNKNFSNVKFVIEDGTLTITAKSIVPDPENPENTMSVNTPSDSKYDGAEHKFVPVVKDGEKTLVEGTDYEVEYSTTDFTNATSEIKVTITGKNNYSGTVERTYKITPRPVTLTSATDSKTYDGTALTNNTVTASTGENEGFVDGEGASYNVTGSQTVVGSSDNTFEYTLNEGTKAGNYNITTKNGTLTVNATDAEVVVTITENSGSYTYDGTEKSVTGYKVTNISNELYSKDYFSFSGNAVVTGTAAGTYNMELKPKDFTNNNKNFSNVKFVIEDGTLTITAKSIVPDPENPNGITVDSPVNSVYDGAEHQFVPVVKDGEKILVEGTDYEVKYSTEDFTNVTGTITVTITGKGNYTGIVERTYQITPKAVTISTETASKVYDGDPLTAGGSIEGIVTGETVTFNVTGSQTEVGTSENTYVLTWDGTAMESNYKIESVDVGALTVTAQTIDPGPDPENPDPNYGGVEIGTLTDEVYNGQSWQKAPTVTDKDGKALTEGTDYTLTWSDDTVNVGTVTVTVTGIGNYAGTVERTYRITPATVIVTADSKAKTFNSADPALTATVTGLIGTDTVNYTLARAAGEDVGNYAITAAGDADQGNYKVTYVPGTLTITAQSINPVDPENPDPNYNGVEVGTLTDEVYNGQSWEKKPTVTGEDGKALTEGTDYTLAWSADTVNVGTVTVTVTGIGNYAGTVERTYEITPRPVTVAANSTAKTFGTADPALTATVTGLVGEDTVAYTLSRAEGETVGEYTITPAGDAAQGNYTVTYATGTLTITAQSINPVDPENPDPNYNGVEVGTLTDEVYNGQSWQKAPTVTDKDGKALTEGTDYTLTWSDDTVNVGTVTVTVTGIGNYAGTVERTYRITPATVIVTADSKAKTFNTADPALTATVTGLIGTDTVEYTLTRAAGEAVGNYAITAAGDADQGNYKVTYVPGTLTITAQSINPVDPENPDPNYNGVEVGTLTDEVYNGQSWEKKPTVTDKDGNALDEGTDYTLAWSDDTVNVGTVTVTVTGIGNYAGTVERTYRITPATVIVTADSKAKTFNTADPALTATVTGLIGTDTVDYTLTRAAGEAVGNYTITPAGDADQGNYKVTYVPGTLTITAQSINPVDPENPDPNYNGVEVGTLTDEVYNGQSWEKKPTVTGEDGNALDEGTDYTLAWSADTVNVGTVTVTVTGIGNYAGTVERTYRITPATVIVTADSKAKTFNTADPALTATVTGLIGTDTVNYTLARAAGEDVGNYAITAAGAETQGNYIVRFVPGTMVITGFIDDPPVVDIPELPPLPEAIDDELTPLGGPEVTVDDPVNIDDEATPLAGEHQCCILHFLILCAALLIELLYINDKKKRQQKIFEMRRELNK